MYKLSNLFKLPSASCRFNNLADPPMGSLKSPVYNILPLLPSIKIL
ncbi:hypothetical protein X975_02815, partial [Stegodyphus mimosarum]